MITFLFFRETNLLTNSSLEILPTSPLARPPVIPRHSPCHSENEVLKKRTYKPQIVLYLLFVPRNINVLFYP